jgi:hypothetical protein
MGVARALHEQRRLRDRGEVLAARALGLARRVQRIAQQHQARAVRSLRGEVGPDAAAHRLAAQEAAPAVGSAR